MKTFKEIINREQEKEYFKEITSFLDEAYETKKVYPPRNQLYRCMEDFCVEDIKVVILGQDPYHQPGQAHGLAFSVEKGVKIPPSLKNMVKELEDDLGFLIPSHGDLSKWKDQGVLLLNTVLSVEDSKPNSHARIGWKKFSQAIIDEVNQSSQPVVFILWGKNAIEKQEGINQEKHLVLTSVHPSPLSAYRGFFGSKPFSQTNQFLIDHGRSPIDWSIE